MLYICLPTHHPRGIPPVHARTTHGPATSKVFSRPDNARFARDINSVSLPGKKEASFLSEINPPEPGNGHKEANKPATESPRVQGRAESSNPYGSDVPPPLRS